MAVFKCKMCGGDLNVIVNETVVQCDYCGSTQTIPSENSEKMASMFTRANDLRRKNDFVRAAGVYESIVAEFPQEAEAYWGLVLCAYGIEYVDDPATDKKIPTCHRSSFDSVLEDPNYKKALELADSDAHHQYRQEAKQLETLRKDINEVSGKEAPYDIFICYKESAADKQRTPESVAAQRVYNELTNQGYRVFFSRITLEDKLGTKFEPYIFAALNSARVMLVFGSSYDNVNSIWVRNEWSRYKQIMAADPRRVIIPCYVGMDPEDMPKELCDFHGQDMNKVGAELDLAHGVSKYFPERHKAASIPAAAGMPMANTGTTSAAKMLKIGTESLAAEDWNDAMNAFNKAKELDPDCQAATFGIALAQFKVRNQQELVNYLTQDMKGCGSKTLQAGSPDKDRQDQMIREAVLPYYLERKELERVFPFDFSYFSMVQDATEKQKRAQELLADNAYLKRIRLTPESEYGIKLFQLEDQVNTHYENLLAKYRQEDEASTNKVMADYGLFLDECQQKISQMRKEADQKQFDDYMVAVGRFEQAKSTYDYMKAKELFLLPKLKGYKDVAQRAEQCDTKVNQIDYSQKQIDDRRILKKTWTKAIVFSAIMALYVLVGLWALDLHGWAEQFLFSTHISADAQSMMYGIPAVGGFILTMILLYIGDDTRNWGFIGKLLFSALIGAVLSGVLGSLLAFGTKILAFMLSQLLLIPLFVIVFIHLLRKSRWLALKHNKQKRWLPILVFVAVFLIMFIVGCAVVKCTNWIL